MLNTRLLHTPHRSIRSSESNVASTCACPRRRAKHPAPDRWFEPLSPSGKGRTDGETRSSPSMLAPCVPHGALGIKRAPRRGYAPAVSDRTWPEQTKSLSLPPSGPSAAPALISRHRFVLCRAVVMFDHWGVAPSTPNEGHNGFAAQMQGGLGKSISAARPPGTRLIRFPVVAGPGARPWKSRQYHPLSFGQSSQSPIDRVPAVTES